MSEPVTLAEILTTASSVANYLGAASVDHAHVARAVALLLGETTMEAIGPPLPPLVRRPPPGPATVAVRELAQRWLAALGGDPARALTEAQVASLRAEVAAFVAAESAG